MLPSILSREVKVGIRRFLESTFPCSTPLFAGSLQRLLDQPGEVFKGPYFSFQLPFKPAENNALPFTEVTYPYRPFLHQSLAFERLAPESPRSTIIATGTGSGKTECFLYPILDHCYRHPEQKGIGKIVPELTRRIRKDLITSESFIEAGTSAGFTRRSTQA